MEPVIWIVLGVLLAVAEVFTTTLFLIMFAVGAAAAAAAAALGAPVLVQVIVFAVVSALTVAVARPAIQRRVRPALEGDEKAFGVEALEGATAMVVEPVDVNGGMIKIDGELWTARSYDGTQVFATGERVRVIEVKGVTAMVWRDDNP
ncbi:Membrane protein implicated in regulation of membrane protease activity [Micromonospora pattaloongensis]|uniref:Membrane protein implicated in regulation of membrane protease activity n=1 Tax=Micromonospora pattaloongensis TaxID=405436 RepID=A0A1H3QF95_9ACTN|nr:NfeD family protein [Micromonospora pattaloongensis]SDZ11953.1 Membrane protein implicated in regulation of membrane protease activity [Micromonospora pattaloongensis]